MRKKYKTERSTIIVTGHSQETKILQVKRKYIENFKLYKRIFFGVCIVFTVLISGAGYYIGKGNGNQQIRQLYGQITHLKNRLDDKSGEMKSEEMKVKQMLDNLNEAEVSLDKIQNYLKERKVEFSIADKKDYNDGIGGEYYPADELNSDLIEEKKEKIQDLLKKIQSIPIGTPHGGRLTSGFGVRGNPFSGEGVEFHPGLDFAANQGDPIQVTANGAVEFAGVRGGYGNCVVVKHGYGYKTLYGHMSRINVKIGQQVKTGDVVGFAGSTGRSTAPHVHYEVIYNEGKENPKKFLNLY